MNVCSTYFTLFIHFPQHKLDATLENLLHPSNEWQAMVGPKTDVVSSKMQFSFFCRAAVSNGVGQPCLVGLAHLLIELQLVSSDRLCGAEVNTCALHGLAVFLRGSFTMCRCC